ncbi:MAG: hypothetical protein SFZ03_05165 [Candidatus Melainabacteria bacterium]|nr:hypothetical protein [Candidatus Melainabacteria bacterium]
MPGQNMTMSPMTMPMSYPASYPMPQASAQAPIAQPFDASQWNTTASIPVTQNDPYAALNALMANNGGGATTAIPGASSDMSALYGGTTSNQASAATTGTTGMDLPSLLAANSSMVPTTNPSNGLTLSQGGWNTAAIPTATATDSFSTAAATGLGGGDQYGQYATATALPTLPTGATATAPAGYLSPTTLPAGMGGQVNYFA